MGRATSMQTIFGSSSLVSSRPLITTMASFSMSAPYSAIVLGKTKTSMAAWRSSSMNRAMRSPFFVYDRRRSVTTPPTERTGARSPATGSSSRMSASVESVCRDSAASKPMSGWSLT